MPDPGHAATARPDRPARQLQRRIPWPQPRPRRGLKRGQLAGRIQVEVSNVATGRVDIQVGFGTIRFYVEVKRELDNATDRALEKSYLAQAADYSGTNAALGQLLVFALTNYPDGVRHLSECAWVTTHRPAGSSVDRYVVVSIVIGNRDTPRTYSS